MIPMDLNELQHDVGKWATHNFGNQPPAYPLIGASEELGELAEAYLNLYRNHPIGVQSRIRLALELQVAVGLLNHSILKRVQGIRQDDEDVGPGAEDAAIQRIYRILGMIEEQPSHDGREVDLMRVPEPDEELVDAVADTVIYLSDFSHRAGVDLDHSVEATWRDVVSDRDWDSDLGEQDG